MRSLFLPMGLAALCALPLPSAAQAATHLSAPPGIRAATADSLTLEAAIGLAFLHNPGLRAAAHDLDIAAGQRIQAAARPNPELSYLAEGTRSQDRTTTVQISQAIELGGKRAARITAAERERDIASADFATQRAALRADVVTAYFAVLTAQERLSLADASQQLSQRASNAAAKRVTAGKISPVEETRARVAEAGTKIELRQATNELLLSRRRLAATWGSTTPVSATLVQPSLPELTGPVAAPMDQLSVSPQLARARLEIARHKALAEVERSRRVPDLTVILGSKRDEQFGQRQTVLGLSVPLPLFDRNQGNLQSALRRANKASDEFRVVENRLAFELAQASLQRDAATAELTILRAEVLPGAQSAYDAATKGFELGKFSFLDVLDAQRTLFQAKTQYLRALEESHRTAGDIARIVGHVGQLGNLSPAVTNQESK